MYNDVFGVINDLFYNVIPLLPKKIAWVANAQTALWSLVADALQQRRRGRRTQHGGNDALIGSYWLRTDALPRASQGDLHVITHLTTRPPGS